MAAKSVVIIIIRIIIRRRRRKRRRRRTSVGVLTNTLKHGVGEGVRGAGGG